MKGACPFTPISLTLLSFFSLTFYNRLPFLILSPVACERCKLSQRNCAQPDRQAHFVDVDVNKTHFTVSKIICISLSLSLCLSLVLWAQCPLVSMTYFTKCLHFLLSIASPCGVQISLLHQSTWSSVLESCMGMGMTVLPR